jgi:hypothetical protein
MLPVSRGLAAIVLVTVSADARAQTALEHAFDARETSEAVATITAGCARCDWGVSGREAAALKLSIDGEYSQHLLLVRGDAPAEYRVLLGSLSPGTHKLTIDRDSARSSAQAGEATIKAIDVRLFGPDTAEFKWLAGAPILYARAGTVEKFSDVPLMMYVEPSPEGQGYDYTVIFSHEDGGTPTDRLMATWGRSTDIEFVYGFSPSADGPRKEEYQGVDHEILPFRGRRKGSHPLLWVSTINNMVSDTGPEEAVRFAPAPMLVKLDRVSREIVMDEHPWLYAITSAEISREGLVEDRAAAGSGKIPDPRRFAVIEACGDLEDATLAFDLAIKGKGNDPIWHPSDRGGARFRIARSGCFRGAVLLPEGSTPGSIAGIRARASTRPPRKDEPPLPQGAGRVTLRSVNTVFMLDRAFKPAPSSLRWNGTLELSAEGPATAIPAGGR